MAQKERPKGHTPKAYRNEAFLNSRDGRGLRILSEYMEPAARFQHLSVADTIVFFGSARIKSKEQAEAALERAKISGEGLERAERNLKTSVYYEAARLLARRLTEWSKALDEDRPRFIVCSGGGPGIMEAANRGASEARGLNVGLGVSLPHEQFNNEYITRELSFEFHYFFMRKLWFVYLAKAVISFPGGFGTLDELFESLTLAQTGKIKKRMPIILFGRDYWTRVMDMDVLIEYGTISPGDMKLFTITDSVDEAFEIVIAELKKLLDQPGAHL